MDKDKLKKIKEYAEPRGLDTNILLSVFKRYNPNDEVIPDYNDLLASIKVPEGCSLLKIKMEIVELNLKYEMIKQGYMGGEMSNGIGE